MSSYKLSEIQSRVWELEANSFDVIVIKMLTDISDVLKDLNERLTSLEGDNNTTKDDINSIRFDVDAVTSKLDNHAWFGNGNLGDLAR